jgi:hypothetical protein
MMDWQICNFGWPPNSVGGPHLVLVGRKIMLASPTLSSVSAHQHQMRSTNTIWWPAKVAYLPIHHYPQPTDALLSCDQWSRARLNRNAPAKENLSLCM